MAERDFKGVWIPKEIWLNKDLSLQEKVFLVEIDSLDKERGCYAGNEYFAEFFELSADRCSSVISSLKEKGYIDVEVERSSGKSLRTIRRKGRVGLGENAEWPLGEKAVPNNTSINNTINTYSELSPAKDSEEDISLEADEDTVPTKKWKRDTAVKAGYKGHEVKPILEWAKQEYGFAPLNTRLQETAISRMLNSGRKPDEIKAKWVELSEDEFWSSKGIDFAVVMSQITKIKTTNGGGPVLRYK